MTPVMKSRVRARGSKLSKANTEKSPQYWNQLVRSDVQVQESWAKTTKLGVQTMQNNFKQYEVKSSHRYQTLIYILGLPRCLIQRNQATGSTISI
jgi:deoxyadenosine/deoxycytidine kinase